MAGTVKRIQIEAVLTGDQGNRRGAEMTCWIDRPHACRCMHQKPAGLGPVQADQLGNIQIEALEHGIIRCKMKGKHAIGFRYHVLIAIR